MKKTRISMKYYVKTVGLTAMLFVICLVCAGTAYPAACIQVTAPNGGETLVPGSSKTISWTYDSAQGPGSLVKIELLKGGAPSATIADTNTIGSNGNGSRNWTVPAQLAGGDDYSIRVTSKAKPACTDTSDGNFHVYTLKIKAPNGGENWVRAQNNIISWDSPGWPSGEKVKLELWKDGNLIGTCFDSLSAGSVLWSTGRIEAGPTWALPGAGYKIKIISLTTNLTDMSDGTFSIAPATVRITSPNGGESWQYNTTKQITWTSSGIAYNENISLELLKGGIVVGSLGDHVSYQSQNSWNWPVGHTYNPYAYTAVGNDFKIRITDKTLNISDESDGFFTIAPGTIRINTPHNKGEIWTIGTVKQITWDTTGCADTSKIKLELSGHCIISNEQVPTNQRSYSWTVGQCADGSTLSRYGSDFKIKGTAKDFCGPAPVTDTSGSFTIPKPEQPTLKIPAYRK